MSESGIEFLQQLAKDPDFADIFCIRAPEEIRFGGNKTEEIEKGFQKFFLTMKSTNNTSFQKWLSTCNFFGYKPYARRHEKLDGMNFSSLIDVSEKSLKALPTWWSKEFPHGLNKSMGMIFDAIDYEVFEDGNIPINVWKTVREKMPSPMDRKEFSKPRVGAILTYLHSLGVIPKSLITKYNDRIKSNENKIWVTISDKPTDFMRVSRGGVKSCLSPGGGYEHTITGALSDPLSMVIIKEDKDIPGDLNATKSRLFFHLMADFDIRRHNGDNESFESFFSELVQLVYSDTENKFETFKRGYKKAIAKQWYIVLDRLYGQTDTIFPFLYILQERAEKNGIKLAVPEAFNFTQGDVNLKFNHSSLKNQKLTIFCPIAYREGWGTYQDNLEALPDYAYNKNAAPNMLYGANGDVKTTCGFIHTFRKGIVFFNDKNDIAKIKVE